MARKEMDCAKILRQIETAVGAAKIGLDIIDSKYNIRYIDPAWKKVYGDPAGRKCYQYFMGRNSVCPHCGVREAFRTKKITVKEEVLAREGNKPIQVTTVPLKDGGEWLVAETNVDITDMKRTDEVLRESEQRYRQLFEENNDAIFMADPLTRRLIDCNRKAVEMTGYSRRELLSMHADQLHPAKTKMIAMKCFKDMASGKITTVDVDVMTKYGKMVPVSICGTPFRVAKKMLIMGIFRDISERNRIEKALSESENKYRLLFEESEDAILVADAQTRKLIDCNKKAVKMTGYPRLKLLSMHAGDMHPRELIHKAMEGFDKQLRGIIKTFDSQVLNREGRRIDVSISATVLEIGGRRLMLGAFRDISDRKKAEDAVRRTNSLLAATIESTFNGILVVDHQGRITQHNQTFASMWRIPKHALATRDDNKVLACVMNQLKDPGSFIKKVKDLYKHQDRESYDTLDFKDGRVFERYSRPQWLGKKIVGRVWTFHDITLHKKAEEVLKRDAGELERLVKTRSAELLEVQDRLYKGKRLADVGRLSATIAHELRSPFSAIRTAAYNIKMKTKDPRLESHIANIDKKILESDQIIKNLLYYSSIKTPHREAFYFCRMMDECVELSRQIFREHKVLIKRICKCGRNFMFEGDPIQLKEVFNNLLNNSYESFSAKKGRIEITTQTGKSYINVRIKDNGPGIDLKDRQKVFEPFFTTKVRGMGLGLPLCSQIISLHNGTIKMTSKPGKGTIVEVMLPLQAKVEKSPKKVA